MHKCVITVLLSFSLIICLVLRGSRFLISLWRKTHRWRGSIVFLIILVEGLKSHVVLRKYDRKCTHHTGPTPHYLIDSHKGLLSHSQYILYAACWCWLLLSAKLCPHSFYCELWSSYEVKFEVFTVLGKSKYNSYRPKSHYIIVFHWIYMS